MARLSSPDPEIDQLLASSAHLQVALQAFLDEQKFVTRRILPGLWQKFLASPHGVKWATKEGNHLPEPDKTRCQVCANVLTDDDPYPYCQGCYIFKHMPELDDIPDPTVPPTQHDDGQFRTRQCNNCGTTYPTNDRDNAHICPVCVQAIKTRESLPTPPAQDDLFDILAKGLQDRLKPQTATLDEERVKALIDYALKAEALHKTHRIIVKKGDEIIKQVESDLPLPKWFDRVYKLARCRVHTLLVGPRGCGKTMTGDLLAHALELPLYTISLSAGVSEGVLQGWLHPSRQGLLFEYNRSSFVKAYTEGGVCLLDELDAADANMLMILNAALANGRWDIPLRGEDAAPLLRHENFICLAAANTHGHGADRVYVGRNQLDGATLDRFAMGHLTVDYDESLEYAAYDQATVQFGQRLRARCRAQKGWIRDVSTRNIADSCKAQKELSLEESWYGYFEDWKDDELTRVGALRNRDHMSITLE